MKKSICIISFSPIARDARVLRQINYAAEHYDVVVIGYGEASPDWKAVPNIRFHGVTYEKQATWKRTPAHLLLCMGRWFNSLYDRWYWSKEAHRVALELASSAKCDLYHANDLEALPLAVSAATVNSAKVFFDAHEYSPLEHEQQWVWRTLMAPYCRYMLKQFSSKVNASSTVCEPIAELYAKEFGLSPNVIMNASECIDAPTYEGKPDSLRLIHHGIAAPERELEQMIDVVAQCKSGTTLDLMLIAGADSVYLNRLKDFAKTRAPGRVKFLEPVSVKRVVPLISTYDMGFYILKPINFNCASALPNKFFDFIAAGLPICIGPSPAMAAIVKERNLGITVDSFESSQIARALNGLTQNEILKLRLSVKQAQQYLNAKTEMGKLLGAYRQLLNS